MLPEPFTRHIHVALLTRSTILGGPFLGNNAFSRTAKALLNTVRQFYTVWEVTYTLLIIHEPIPRGAAGEPVVHSTSLITSPLAFKGQSHLNATERTHVIHK